MARRRVTQLAALAIGIGMLDTAPALAHGPCQCLIPTSGPPGTAVSSGQGAYKVIFNPDRTDLGIGPRALWREHRPTTPPAVLFRETYRYSDLPLRDAVEFRVPAAPPGRYLVAIYDGSEGGAHYTWARFRITSARASRSSAPPVSSGGDGVSTPAALIIGLAGLGSGALLSRVVTRRRGRRSVP